MRARQASTKARFRCGLGRSLEWVPMNVVLLLLLAAGSPPCSFQVPEGWQAAAPGPGEVQAIEEPYQRDDVVVRTRIALRAQEAGKLDEALRRARAEEQARLG